MYPCEKKLIEQIRENASRAFADHVVTQNVNQGLYRHWRCQKPGAGMYHFNVITEPGRLIVTGDIGTLILCREQDMLPWARRAMDDPYYMAGKCQAPEPYAWSSDVCRDWLERERRDVLHDLAIDEEAARKEGEELTAKERKKYTDLLDKIAKLAEEVEGGEHAFTQAVHDSGLVDGCDWPRLETFTPNFLWCREALRWFLERTKE